MAIVRVEKNNYTVESLHQWDLNRTLEIYGLSMPKTPEIHFTNDLMVAAVRRYATMDAAGVIRVEVPNALLQQPHTIKAMVCIREGEVFKTCYTVRIPVKPRQKPADYTITDEEDVYSFLALEDLVQDSVASMTASNAALQKSLTAKYESVAGPAAEAVDTANAAAAQAVQAAQAAQSVAGTANAALNTAQQALETAQKPVALYYVITLPASGWVGVEAPYVQAVTLESVTAEECPHYGVVYSGTTDQKLQQREAFACIDDLETGDGILTFTCFDSKPTVDIWVQIECHGAAGASGDYAAAVLSLEEGEGAPVQALVDGTNYNVPNAVLNGTPTDKIYDFTVL